MYFDCKKDEIKFLKHDDIKTIANIIAEEEETVGKYDENMKKVLKTKYISILLIHLKEQVKLCLTKMKRQRVHINHELSKK